jgi:hypothetical protein
MEIGCMFGGGSEDKALVKPNMALYHKRRGPTN